MWWQRVQKGKRRLDRESVGDRSNQPVGSGSIRRVDGEIVVKVMTIMIVTVTVTVTAVVVAGCGCDC